MIRFTRRVVEMEYPRLPLQDPIRGIAGRMTQTLIEDLVVNKIPQYQRNYLPIRFVPAVRQGTPELPVQRAKPSMDLLQQLMAQQVEAQQRRNAGG